MQTDYWGYPGMVFAHVTDHRKKITVIINKPIYSHQFPEGWFHMNSWCGEWFYSTLRSAIEHHFGDFCIAQVAGTAGYRPCHPPYRHWYFMQSRGSNYWHHHTMHINYRSC